MTIWNDIVRTGAAVATGGLSEVVLDAAAGPQETAPPPAADSPATGSGGIGFGGGPIGKLFPGLLGVSASGAACGCSRYELKPPFLLDNTTGEVWVYDEHTKHFGMVEVERSPVAKSVLNLIGAKVALDLRHKLEKDGLVVNRAQYTKLAPFVDDTMKAVDHHLEKMRQP